MNNNLIGIWKTDPTDIIAKQLYGIVIMKFKDNGELIYTINEGDKEQKIFMTYQVSYNLLIMSPADLY